MIKKTYKTDCLFVTSILCLLLYHFTLARTATSDHIFDEVFYALVPYRLITGDSLVQHEWHLTQFSSLFLYLPIRFWILIKGSVEGIYLYLRLLYMCIHTSVTVVIYKFFKNYGIPAVIAAIMYNLLIPYTTYALSYTSMLAIFYLFFTISLYSTYKNPSYKTYISTGFFFGCCCVNNPIFCILFASYLILCLLWTKKDVLIKLLSNYYIISKTEKNNPQKSRKKLFVSAKINAKKKMTVLNENFANYNPFFSKEAIIYSFCGICIIAIICLIFFFATGGSLATFFDNIKNLIQASEYSTTSKVAWIQKSFDYKTAINEISLHMPFLLPIFFFTLLIDKKRKNNIHRIIHLIISLVLTFLFFFGVLNTEKNTALFFSFPFTFFSLVCYILTNKRQTDLFFCIWCPCTVAALLASVASNTLFYSSSSICAISNIVGVFFTCRLFIEISTELEIQNKKYSSSSEHKSLIRLGQVIIIITLCLQIGFSCFYAQDKSVHKEECTIKATSGPLKGLYFDEESYRIYENTLKNLDYIKEISNENDPLFVMGNLSWTYMYAQRPFATYTACYLGFFHQTLSEYYKKNPDKVPKYIYILTIKDSFQTHYAEEFFEEEKEALDSMFEYNIEKLPDGILLTINDYIYQEDMQS